MPKFKVTCPKCGSPMLLRHGKYGRFYGCSTYPKCRETMDYKKAQKMAKAATVVDEPKREFEPSSYQVDVFEFIVNGAGNAVVEAVAGSGKTTTIVKALELTPKDDSVLFCAFNRHIADELKERAPAHVRVGTLHSIGFAALREHLPHKPEVDEKKLWNIVKEVLPSNEDYPLRAPLAKLVSLAKATLTDASNIRALENIASYYCVELNGNTERLLSLVPVVLAICLERSHIIDYDDMIWMPVVLNLAMDKYDWVFIDEAQDLNKSQIEMVLGLTNGDGRVVAVGDRNQSIYGFRGADVTAIPRLIKALDATTLPLSITYRCPKGVVELAQKLVPQIEAAEWAEEGIVRDGSYNQMTTTAKDGDLILCRVNAPLVKACYGFIRSGRKAVIRGRDIGKSLQNMIDRLNPHNINDLITKIQDYKWEQSEKLRRAGKEDRIESLYDRCDTLNALCDGIDSLSTLRQRIRTIFDDITKTGIILSSIHRAKGDESDRVWLLNPELLPHPLAKKPWQLEQERNIEYVAYTRSKRELVFVRGDVMDAAPEEKVSAMDALAQAFGGEWGDENSMLLLACKFIDQQGLGREFSEFLPRQGDGNG